MRRALLITPLLISLLATSPARAEVDRQVMAGISLAGIGGAGALVADFGSLVYISNLEYAKAWGWLSLLSGLVSGTGGVILARVEPSAKTVGSLLIIFSAASMVIGIAGIALPRAGHRYHAGKVALSPFVSPDGHSAGMLLGGRF